MRLYHTIPAEFVEIRRWFMNRRISVPKISVLFIVALFALIISAFAYSVPDDTIVYVAPSGSKYHREDCSYTTSVRPMTIKEAERKGYDACSRCDPDRLTGEYHSNWDGKNSSTDGGSDAKNNPNTKPSESPPVKDDTPIWLETLKIIGGLAWGCVVSFCGMYAFGLLFYIPSFIKKLFKRK